MLFNVNNVIDEFIIIELEEGLVEVGSYIRVCLLNGCIIVLLFKYMFD